MRSPKWKLLFEWIRPLKWEKIPYSQNLSYNIQPMNTDIQWLSNLNPAQQQAATAPFGNVLVLAGAGSGKTRVLVHRIAWLLLQDISAYSILAVTFTNKAAGEMRGRLHSMVGRDISGMWVGTFHGLANKMLRLHWREANLSEQFQIIDSEDQLQIIRRGFKALNINEDRFEPKKAQNFINRKKDEGVRAHAVARGMSLHDEVMKEIYQYYENHTRENQLVDFAELILASYELLKNNEELRQHYQARFSHFLVDEFQDTNTIQYAWLSLLAKNASSVTIVGDDDQSIYGWRGAKIENLRRFEKEFSDTFVIRLEQNYRSTGTILSAANALIANNGSRLGKTLWTAGEEGEAIQLYAAFTEEDEAMYVVRQVRANLEKGRQPKEVGVLYRSNAQSRILEEALMRANIPYVIYGGLRFFERAEIKDALAYLRLAANLNDNTSFERIVNVPPRGIGDRSLEKIKEIAEQEQTSYWEAAQKAIALSLFTGKIAHSLTSFIHIIHTILEKMEEGTLSDTMACIIETSGLLTFFKEQKGEKSLNRAENLEELLSATVDFEEELSEEESSPLNAFLGYTALESGETTAHKNEHAIQLMTLHSAKGLEFPVVFICGLEEGLFPHHFSSENKESLEEERRLCYVGITRAMQSLYLTYSEKRRLFGREEERRLSRFIHEIPEHLIQEARKKVTLKSASKNWIESQLPPDDWEALGEFCLGQRVRHPKFGQGTIIDHEGALERARVHVKFDMYGNKWLALAFAKLEAVL